MSEAKHTLSVTNVPQRAEVLDVIFTELEKVNEDKITLSDNTDITTDMNVDSVTIMDLMFEIEESFDIVVPLNDLADVQTIGQLCDLVLSIANQTQPGQP